MGGRVAWRLFFWGDGVALEAFARSTRVSFVYDRMDWAGHMGPFLMISTHFERLSVVCRAVNASFGAHDELFERCSSFFSWARTVRSNVHDTTGALYHIAYSIKCKTNGYVTNVARTILVSWGKVEQMARQAH